MPKDELSSEVILPGPLPAHPRLMVCASDWERIRQQLKSDSASARIFAALRKKAALLLGIPPLERIIDGFRLLRISRQALERISLLSMVAQVDGDQRLVRRAIDEMIQIAKFSDWNPSHYLDTAEMSLALAIGYDWLYEFLSGGERDLIANALRDKGINPSFGEPEQWFIRGNNNWNQVCHAGLSAAAIAIADREPELALTVLRRAVENLPAAASAYAPDGAYPEGPVYWNYGTLYHVVLADALQRFLGTACGTDAYPGFAASAEYITQMTTPTDAFYAYADARPSRHMLVPLYWFARQFRRPDWVSAELEKVDHYMGLYEGDNFDDSNYRLLALTLLWRDTGLVAKPGAKKPLHWLGKGSMPVVAHRSAFNDPNALYAAIKGGSPSLNHAHMDVGSFMIQSGGVTWAMDLGMQQYESLESIDVNVWDASKNGTRWSIFRPGPESHNILRFNGAHQVLEGNGQFIRFQPDGPTPHSVLDLTPLYEDQVARAHRGLMFVENRAVLVQDEWTASDQTCGVTWQMLTAGEVSIHPGEIRLRRDGKSMALQILDSPRVEVEAVDTSTLLKDFDAPSPGVSRITIKLRTEAGQNGRLRIFAVPEPGGGIPPPPFQPLSEWS